MLGYLASKGPTLEPFVISGFIQLLCRVTKLGWFDEGDVMRQLVTETTKFLEVCPGYGCVATGSASDVFPFLPCTNVSFYKLHRSTGCP